MDDALDIRKLRKCKLCPTLGKDHVPALGNEIASIMLIGQSPGATEVEEGLPFVGPSGQLLDYMLDEARLDRSDVYITNALKCRPPGNRAGHDEELACCMKHWLMEEIVTVKPAIIVLIGKDAWKSVTGGRIPFVHGKSHKGKKRVFLTVYHPGYFLRRGDMGSFIEVGKTLRVLYESI